MQKRFDNIASNPRKVEMDGPASWQVPVDWTASDAEKWSPGDAMTTYTPAVRLTWTGLARVVTEDGDAMGTVFDVRLNRRRYGIWILSRKKFQWFERISMSYWYLWFNFFGTC